VIEHMAGSLRSWQKKGSAVNLMTITYGGQGAVFENGGEGGDRGRLVARVALGELQAVNSVGKRSANEK